MKRNTIFALALAAFALPALAGPGGHGEFDREARLDRLAAQLELSDEQMEPFARVMDEQHERRRARREAHRQVMEANGGPSPELREQMREQRKLARQEMRDALSGVLTPEQLEKFEEITRKHGPRGPGERGRKWRDRDSGDDDRT